MGRAKEIIVKPISAKDANLIVKALHYSGKVVQNSQLHFGVFLDGKCGGALQFGPSLDKRKMLGLVEGTLWNEFIELNRMALAEWLPRNGESRAISVAMRMLRKTYPHIQWVVSFADATQSGDGTIYRASGFVLTALRINSDLWKGPIKAPYALPAELQRSYNRFVARHGRVFHNMTLQGGERHSKEQRELRAAYYQYNRGSVSNRCFVDLGCQKLPGYQLRYIYFLDPTARDRLAVPVIPFGEIAKRGAAMYLGVGSADSGTPATHAGGGGASPTSTLD